MRVPYAGAPRVPRRGVTPPGKMLLLMVAFWVAVAIFTWWVTR